MHFIWFHKTFTNYKPLEHLLVHIFLKVSKSVSIPNPSPNVIQNDQLHLAIVKQECKWWEFFLWKLGEGVGYWSTSQTVKVLVRVGYM